MENNLDPKKVEEVKDYAVETCRSEGEIAEACEVDEEKILEYLAAAKVSCCATCGWWYDEEDMSEENSELVCPDCVTEKDND